MATAKQVRLRAAELGVTIDDDCDGNPENWLQDVTINAPRGFVFACTGTHHCVSSKGNAGLIPKSEVWQSVLDDMAMGLEPCTDPDCEACTETL